jgi:hypothetical protein
MAHQKELNVLVSPRHVGLPRIAQFFSHPLLVTGAFQGVDGLLLFGKDSLLGICKSASNGFPGEGCKSPAADAAG